MGLPILIVAPEGEATRIVEQAKAGLVVPAEDPAALAAAVRRLATDKDLRADLAAASLAAAPRHSRQFQADAMMAALEAAAAGEGATAASRVAAVAPIHTGQPAEGRP